MTHLHYDYSRTQRAADAELDEAIRETQECCSSLENQGRGPAPERASLIDWVLAVLIGTCLYFAFVAWFDEPNQNANGKASTRRVVT